MAEEQGIILPPGVEASGHDTFHGERSGDPGSHAIIVNETGLPGESIEDAARTYFVEQASVGGIGRAPSTFGVYSANQGSLLARTEYRTPTNIIEEIKLARELAERDDDIASVIGSMLALAFGDGMENFHEDERTVAIYNSIAFENNLDRILRELYREYLISYQVNTVSLFTRTSVDFTIPSSQTQDTELISWPYVGVLPAEYIRVLDNDIFGTGTLAYVPHDQRLREWLREFFNPRTSAAKKGEMARQDRVAAAMFVAEVDAASLNMLEDADLVNSDGKVYVLNPRIVHRHTGPKGMWKYPRPLLTRDFSLLEAKRLLNLMDFALLQGGANFVVVARKGTDQRPATVPELRNLEQVVRRTSRTGVIVGDHRLQFDIITPDLQALLDPAKRRLIGRKLARGLLRLPELDDESSAEGARLDAEFIARIIANDRHELKRHVERTAYRETAKRNPRFLTKGHPKLWFPKIILQGSQYFNDLVLKLRDRGDIPRQWAVEAGGFDWEAAVQQRQREKDAGTDEIMAPAQIPFSSPDIGPQDNNSGRPPGGNQNGRPRQRIGQNQGETITASYDEEIGQVVRIGEITLAILEEHAAYDLGRVTQTERDLIDGEESIRRGSSMYVPVNPGHECASYQAVNLTEGLRMVVGVRPGDGGRVAKLLVFREPHYSLEQAEECALRWGYPISRPEEDDENSGIGRAVRALVDALRGRDEE